MSPCLPDHRAASTSGRARKGRRVGAEWAPCGRPRFRRQVGELGAQLSCSLAETVAACGRPPVSRFIIWSGRLICVLELASKIEKSAALELWRGSSGRLWAEGAQESLLPDGLAGDTCSAAPAAQLECVRPLLAEGRLWSRERRR